jgi:hypothetical protein
MSTSGYCPHGIFLFAGKRCGRCSSEVKAVRVSKARHDPTCPVCLGSGRSHGKICDRCEGMGVR